MLIAGCVPAYFYFGERGGAKYWASILGLLAMSWLANTLRVIAIVVAAVSYGSEFAMGTFHQVGGWLVLVAMFALCCGTFALLQRLPSASPAKACRMKRRLCALAGLGFCVWQARDLFTAWRYAPFDRLDPAAFASMDGAGDPDVGKARWVFRSIPPLSVANRRHADDPRFRARSQRAAKRGAGGGAWAVSRQRGLAFAPWLLGAVAWWPAFGWAVSGGGRGGGRRGAADRRGRGGGVGRLGGVANGENLPASHEGENRPRAFCHHGAVDADGGFIPVAGRAGPAARPAASRAWISPAANSPFPRRNRPSSARRGSSSVSIRCATRTW